MPEPSTLAELQDAFLESLGKIEGHARRKFHYLHGDDLDEAVQETVALAWAAYHRLFMQGRAIEGKRGGIAIFSAKSVASGGRLVGQHPINDVMSPTFRGHSLGPPREDELVELSTVEEAAFRVDLEAWLASLDERKRQIVDELAAGHNTVEVARLHRVSRMRIYQMRCELIEDWERFQEQELARYAGRNARDLHAKGCKECKNLV